MSSVRVASLAAAIALALVSTPLLAQRDARLTARLDGPTAAAVQATVDAARRDGLPSEPLVLKALEGASKSARGSQIVAVVTRLHGQLGQSRAALGPSSTEAEIMNGASAIQAGVSIETLRGLRAAQARGSVATALSVITDLVARGVPVATAAQNVLALLREGAGDEQLIAYRTGIERGMAAGAPASAAANAAAARGSRGGPPASVPVTPGRPPRTQSGSGRPPTL